MPKPPATQTKYSSKERVLKTFARCEPDRVPINYSANPGIDARLKTHFGLNANDGEGLCRNLGVDFRGIWVAYTGPRLHQDIPEHGVKVDMWGIHRKWVEHASGGYWDYCDFPLKDATADEIASWARPSPDDFDYSHVAEQCSHHKDYAIHVGDPGLGDIINSNGMLRSMDQILVDLMTDDEAGLLLIRRKADIQLEVTRRTLEAAKGAIDFVWMGEDLGTQIAPLISMELYKKHIQPIHQQFISLAKSFHLPVMIHSCGSSSWAYDEFIKMGINAVDTLQPEAKDMSPAYLKARYGDRLAFHGCISTAGTVAYGTAEETALSCKKTLEIMMPGGGYCFAPTHMLQDNSPTENVLAMYEAVHQFGWYHCD